MDYKIERGCRDNAKWRSSFDKLSVEIFGLSFEKWYQNGFWGEKFRPYSIVIGDEVISNVSVNLIDCHLNGAERHYIQLGTVMTKKEYRKKGYNRILMESILHEYRACDGFFLFANDSVLDYYGKFGFERTAEYRYRGKIKRGGTKKAVPVSMKCREDWNYFLREKSRRKSNGVMSLRNDGLLMFYLSHFMQESVFYIERLDAYVIAETENGILLLYEVYSKDPVSMEEVCSCFGGMAEYVSFAFTPLHTEGLEKYEYKEENTTYFVRGRGIQADMKTICSIPAVAHA